MASVALISSAPGWAQQTVAADTDAEAASSEPQREPPEEVEPPSAEGAPERVVVTGSRIQRQDGYEAPTPLDVVSGEEVEARAQGNIAGLLTTMPVFVGNLSPAQTAVGPSGGTTGINAVSIRGLGTSRSLVLVDGQRFVPILAYGTGTFMAVDVGVIPQQLIRSVETVTGGASAIYGSDAIGGVTNFILDRDFTGFKADVSGGMTGYGDDRNWKVDLTTGFDFLDKGHMLLSASWADKEDTNDTSNRDWADTALCQGVLNPAHTPTNGQPQRVSFGQCGEVAAPGGVIGVGPLAGTTFGPGGQVVPFQIGSFRSGQLMSGGSYRLTVDDTMKRGGSLSPGEERQNGFGLISYDLTETLKVTVQGLWSHTFTETQSESLFFDTEGAIIIRPDNAFIPESIRAAVVAGYPVRTGFPNGGFSLLTLNDNLPPISTFNHRYVTRGSIEFDGEFNLFTDWKWNAYYQYGFTRAALNAVSLSRTRYARAVDAVRNANGVIVCRVNADAITTNDDPACRPHNMFGIGVATQESKDYIKSIGHINQANSQSSFAASMSGEPFSLWAGPVGIALSAEYREEEASGIQDDPLALANDYFSGNYKAVNGSLNVTEGAIEALVPLAQGLPLIDRWDLELAARLTDYSTSGQVTSWKVGTTYAPFADLRLRGSVSKDIRAGNLGELYGPAGALQPTSSFVDRFTNTSGLIFQTTSGNPDLVPEEAKNYGFGFVYQPSALPGLSTSIDWWLVEVEDQIATIGSAQAVTLCFSGNQQYCSFITRSGAATLPGAVGTPYEGQFFAPISSVITGVVNIASQMRQGIDSSITYRADLEALSLPGDLTFNLNGTYYFKQKSSAGFPGAFPTYTAPSLRLVGNLAYDLSPFRVGLTARYTHNDPNPMIYECASGCPNPNTLGNPNIATWNYEYRNSKVFLDANMSYDFAVANGDWQLYMNIRNLLNEDPVLNPPSIQPFAFQQSVSDDALGRVWRVGLRMRY